MKKGNLGGKIFFLLFFGLFICTVGGSLLDSCIKLYKVNKIYTDIYRYMHCKMYGL